MARRRGRPPHKPTRSSRHRVMRLRADGWSKERIARLLGTDHETLQKHYAEELEHGADIKTDALLGYAEKAAERGSQASIKWLSERYDAARAQEQLDGRANQSAPEQAASPQPKPPALGKKELRQQAANEGAGIFETPPPPPSKLN